MFVFGVVSTLLSSFLYSFRSSIFRDFGIMPINKASVTLFYRLFSLPIIIIVFCLSRQSTFVSSSLFYLWFTIAIFLNLFCSFFQLRLYQKHELSTVESQKFIGVIFASLFGYYVFSEYFTTRELWGLLVIVFSFIILYLFENRRKFHFDVVLYYFLLTCIDIVNRQTIRSSTPLIFSLYITIAMVISNYVVLRLRRQPLYQLTHPHINSKLIISGIISSFTVIGLSYGYQYLPIGLVVTILSTQTFFSLGLSHFKHRETNLLPKIITSSMAFFGIVIMFV
jgi:drug/metabolite transporter (DMT)-like permease